MKTVALTILSFALLSISTFAQSTPAGDTVSTGTGLRYIVTHKGDGRQPTAGNVVVAHYTGTFLNGEIFDSSHDRDEPFAFTLGQRQVIRGWDEGFALLHVGDRATFIIPPDLAYGSQERGPIPANSTLIFDVEFLDVKDRSLADDLRQIDTVQGFEKTLARYQRLKSEGFPGLYVSESQLNMLGYAMLNENRASDAIEIFKLNVEAYPESANVYDSLAEGYMNNGDSNLAITNYKKSLELNPKNNNAVEMLKKLQEK